MAKSLVRRKKVTVSKNSPKKTSNKINLTDKSYTPILLVLLLIASFLLGALSTKLSFLEKGQTGNSPAGTQGTAPNQIPSPGTKTKINIDSGHLPILGKKDAKVTIIEFADFQCPFCERFFKDVLPNLKKDYVDTGKVKLSFRHYAFLGQESTWAALASECANEQGKFWEYHDYLYNNQGPENSGTFAKEKLVGFAQNLGLNTNQFSSCLNSDKYSKNVSEDLSAGQKAGVTGTPSTFINGQLIVGAQPYTAFKTLIDEELKKAK
ncbi:MAG: DsbA family protein [Candidatus Pacearchaeota archaeon]